MSEVLGSPLSWEVKASEQIEQFRPFDPDWLFPSHDPAKHHCVALPRENCSTTHRKRSRFQAGDLARSFRPAQSSDRSRCRSEHPDSPPMLHIFCSCLSLMHEFQDVATWIGGLGSGPDHVGGAGSMQWWGHGRVTNTTRRVQALAAVQIGLILTAKGRIAHLL